MSQPSQPDHAADMHAAESAARPAPQPDEVRAEIEAEIADHLAAAMAAKERTGIDHETAKRQALERFGNVKRVIWQCFWIRLGDQIMFRAAAVAFCLFVV